VTEHSESDQPNCIENIWRCRASCCRHLFFQIEPDDFSEWYWAFDVPEITRDDADYLILHGAKVLLDLVLVRKNDVKKVDGGYEVDSICKALMDDFTCNLHPDRKPVVCKELTAENVGLYHLTDGCVLGESGNSSPRF